MRCSCFGFSYVGRRILDSNVLTRNGWARCSGRLVWSGITIRPMDVRMVEWKEYLSMWHLWRLPIFPSSDSLSPIILKILESDRFSELQHRENIREHPIRSRLQIVGVIWVALPGQNAQANSVPIHQDLSAITDVNCEKRISYEWSKLSVHFNVLFGEESLNRCSPGLCCCGMLMLSEGLAILCLYLAWNALGRGTTESTYCH